MQGRQLSRAAETWEDYMDVCVSVCKGAPFPNLLKQDSFWGVPFESLETHKESSFWDHIV